MNIRKFFAIGISSLMLMGCGAEQVNKTNIKIETSSWEEIVDVARGSTVTYYGWGGDEKVNQYIDKVVATTVKDQYDITLKRVGMDISEIMTKLLTEKQQDAVGTMDIVWLNGENFYTAKTNDLLHGGFLEQLPNAVKYLDLADESNQYDFGVATEGMEAPLGKAQFVMLADTDAVTEIPKTVDDLKSWIKAHPGKFTYPEATEFTGSAFVRNIIFQLIEPTLLNQENLDKEQIREIIKPGMDYLKEIKPYLWRAGETYPSTYAQLSNMFADGEVKFCMTYTANGVAKMIEDGIYPESTQSFVFNKGTLGNTHFLTVPQNASNKAGALVVINEMLSPILQAKKMEPSSWADLTSLDLKKLSVEEKQLFETLPQGKGTLSIDQIGNNLLTEPHAKYISIIEEIWQEEILR